MNKLLSQEEIDQLLGSVTPALAAAASARPAVGIGDTTVSTYDFRRPDRISKDQIRSLQLVHDRFARNLSTSLSAYLRTATDVGVVSVEQCVYSEFLMSLPELTAYYALSLGSRDIIGALELNASVAFMMVDRLLGGNGEVTIPNRGLTEIEQNVVDAAVKLILENLTEAWRPIVERIVYTVQARETRPQMLQVLSPNEGVIVFVFDVKVGHARGMMNLCLPASVVELAGANLGRSWQRVPRAPKVEDEQRLANALSRVPLQVSARIETTMRAHDVVDLKPGDVLGLGHSARMAVDILVGSTPKFKGRLSGRDGRASVAIVESVDGGVLGEAGI